MSEILDRLLQLRWDNSLEYLEDDSENAKEYQQLKSKIEQSLKFFEHGKKLNQRDIDMGDWTDNALEIINDSH